MRLSPISAEFKGKGVVLVRTLVRWPRPRRPHNHLNVLGGTLSLQRSTIRKTGNRPKTSMARGIQVHRHWPWSMGPFHLTSQDQESGSRLAPYAREGGAAVVRNDSLTQSLTDSLTLPLIHSRTQSLTDALSHSLARGLADSLASSFTQ